MKLRNLFAPMLGLIIISSMLLGCNIRFGECETDCKKCKSECPEIPKKDIGIASWQPAIQKCELYEMRGFFRQQFADGDNGNSPVDSTIMDVLPESLMHPFDTMSCEGPKILTIHHGLIDVDGINKITVALSYDCIANQNGIWTVPQPTYAYYTIRGNGQLEYFPSGLTNWKETHFQTNYENSIVVKRNENSGSWENVDDASTTFDVRQISYKQRRIEELIEDNPGLDKVRITSVAEPERWTNNDVNNIGLSFKHKFALVCTNGESELVDDGAYMGYNNRALDIGSPCPKYCPDNTNGLVFSTYGIKHRGCEYSILQENIYVNK